MHRQRVLGVEGRTPRGMVRNDHRLDAARGLGVDDVQIRQVAEVESERRAGAARARPRGQGGPSAARRARRVRRRGGAGSCPSSPVPGEQGPTVDGTAATTASGSASKPPRVCPSRPVRAARAAVCVDAGVRADTVPPISVCAESRRGMSSGGLRRCHDVWVRFSRRGHADVRRSRVRAAWQAVSVVEPAAVPAAVAAVVVALGLAGCSGAAPEPTGPQGIVATITTPPASPTAAPRPAPTSSSQTTAATGWYLALGDSARRGLPAARRRPEGPAGMPVRCWRASARPSRARS